MRENKEIIPTLKTVPIKEDVSQGERMGLPKADIESGNTVSFMDSDGSMFYVAGGTKVSFSVELDRTASVQMGYIGNNGAKTQTYSGTSSSHNTSFKISNISYYRFYVTNLFVKKQSSLRSKLHMEVLWK
ncbi:MAG: hypothetical protein K2M46_05050 [Lachnospiraceae bacterium]|nr:hypothetical protein [Lachnospiraceae bacterium]